MQINKTILMLAVVMLLSPIFTLQAVETTTTPKKIDAAKLEEFKARLKKEAETVKTNLETSKSDVEKKLDGQNSVKVKLAAKSQEKIKKVLEKIYTKFNTQINKMQQVDEKIASRISTLEKGGLDMKDAKAQYAVAKAALDKATSDILATRMFSMEQITKEISKETIRTLVKSGEESLKNVGAEYRKTLPIMAKENNIKKVEEESKN